MAERRAAHGDGFALCPGGIGQIDQPGTKNANAGLAASADSKRATTKVETMLPPSPTISHGKRWRARRVGGSSMASHAWSASRVMPARRCKSSTCSRRRTVVSLAGPTTPTSRPTESATGTAATPAIPWRSRAEQAPIVTNDAEHVAIRAMRVSDSSAHGQGCFARVGQHSLGVDVVGRGLSRRLVRVPQLDSGQQGIRPRWQPMLLPCIVRLPTDAYHKPSISLAVTWLSRQTDTL